VCAAVAPVAVAPFPKSHAHPLIAPSASLDVEPSTVIAPPETAGAGNRATGSAFGAVTATVRVVLAVAPALSVTVSVTT
jgi:hypothetical protein